MSEQMDNEIIRMCQEDCAWVRSNQKYIKQLVNTIRTKRAQKKELLNEQNDLRQTFHPKFIDLLSPEKINQIETQIAIIVQKIREISKEIREIQQQIDEANKGKTQFNSRIEKKHDII